ncbi:protein kinase [Streptomyces bacillaris]|uniref:protein kinase domain-containing protein n=1 Tax=Streptomyces bacillaris TaxID=68179 RepID=UPI00345FC225
MLLPVEGPRLIDFGISQAHDLTRTQSALGTVAYASPEQARGEPTTEASDMFSVGATLFYLAVGRPPYRDIEHISAMELLVRAATGDIDTTGLPAELDSLVLPCLDPDPRSRPPRPRSSPTAPTTSAAARRRGAAGGCWTPAGPTPSNGTGPSAPTPCATRSAASTPPRKSRPHRTAPDRTSRPGPSAPRPPPHVWPLRRTTGRPRGVRGGGGPSPRRPGPRCWWRAC